MKDSKILIIDDNEDVLIAARLLLKPLVKTITTANNPANILSLLNSESYDIIFLDMNFTKDTTSGEEGFFWLKKILEIDHQSVVILITAYGEIELAVKAIKEGATDFITKPWQNEKFVATLSSAVKLKNTREELLSIREKQHQLASDINHQFEEIIGISPAIRHIFTTIEKIAKTEANILILGENGTGKELVARAIHQRSHRGNEIFISVDMGSLSSTLFESELFGYMKGAFTDAKEDRAGRFEIANNGTLFLDEIGNLPYEQQAKLLSVLQNRQITRLGSSKPKPIDIRLICATNMNLDELVNQNKFRQDLLYRINTVEINLPPLRSRREDIPLLTEHFLNLYKKKYNKSGLSISKETITKLMNYRWPGNIRELQHTIERSVILAENDILSPDDFFFKQEVTIKEITSEAHNLETLERETIKRVIEKYGGNITKAAKELGLTRTSLYRRIEKFEL